MKDNNNILKVIVVSFFLIIVFCVNLFLLVNEDGYNQVDSDNKITSEEKTIILQEIETTITESSVEIKSSETKPETESEETTTEETTTEFITTSSHVETQPPTTQEITTTQPQTTQIVTQPPTQPHTQPQTTQVVTQPPTQSPGTVTITTELSNVDTENYINEVIRLVNIERNREGLSSLTRNEKLCDLALVRAGEIVEVFSHSRPDGSDCFTIFDEYGFVINGYAGENLAKGHRSPQEVIKGWMNSQGHKDNILSSDFKEIGIGIVKFDGVIYWTQLFYGSID